MSEPGDPAVVDFAAEMVGVVVVDDLFDVELRDDVADAALDFDVLVHASSPFMNASVHSLHFSALCDWLCRQRGGMYVGFSFWGDSTAGASP